MATKAQAVEQQPHSSFLGTLLVLALIGLALAGVAERVGIIDDLQAFIRKRLPVRTIDHVKEVLVEKPPPAIWLTRAELEDLVFEKVPAAGIDPRIFFVLAGKESGSRWSTTRERFEPRKLGEMKRFFQPWMTDREKERFATSYGLFQILFGYHKELCGLKEHLELYQPEKNLACALKVWETKLTQAKRLHPQGPARLVLWETFRAYNGSGPDAERYANDAMSRYTDMLVEDAMRQG